MAMSMGDAADVQCVLNWVCGTYNSDPDVTGDAPREALIRLADRSYKVMGAGERGEYVAGRWPVPGLPRGTRAPAEGGPR